MLCRRRFHSNQVKAKFSECLGETMNIVLSRNEKSHLFHFTLTCDPRSKRTDWIRPEFNGIHRIMEAVFQLECLRIFPVISG
jgi:hypothetical protein